MYSIVSFNKQLKLLMEMHNVNAVSFAIFDSDTISDSMLAKDKLAYTNPSTKINVLSPAPHLFQGCSFSKCILSLSVMLLIQQGKLGLDDKVAERLISWKLPNSCDQNITIRQCLALTSGLAYEATSTHADIYLQTDPIPSLKDILNGKCASKTGKIYSKYPAGAYYSYSGASYMLLQQLIEDITQQSYTEYINQTIFKPLGMNNSFLTCPLANELHALVVPGYDIKGKQNSHGWYNNPYTGSGGLWTTVKDMALFMREIMHAFHGKSHLLHDRTLANDMLSSQSLADFGLGFSIDKKDHFHIRKQGYNQGYYHELIVSPLTHTGIVIMTNSAAAKSLVEAFIEYYMDGEPYNLDFDEVKTLDLRIMR